jgi:hypothetical protein
MKKLIVLSLLLSSAVRLSAALEWQSNLVRLEAQPQQAAVEAVYTFKNTGDQPVLIVSAKGSRGCLVDQHALGAYQPGASGTLKVHFQIGSRVGAIVENISVVTSDAKEPVVLRLVVNVPVLFRLDREVVEWTVGSATTPQEISFVDLSGTGVKPTLVYSTDENIQATLTRDNAPDRWVVKLTPQSTARAGVSPVYLDVDVGGGRVRKMRILALITDGQKGGVGVPHTHRN